MAKKTHIDQIINYTHEVISKIKSSKEVMGLIANNANIDLNDESSAQWESHIYDYDYIDDIPATAGAYIMVDTDVVKASSGTINDFEIYVQVVCSKEYMTLSPSIFKGVKGNRRDNIAREVDLLLNKSNDFGIGQLELSSARTATSPQGFTSKLLIYSIPDFSTNTRI